MKRITRVILLLAAPVVIVAAVVIGCCLWPLENTWPVPRRHPWAQRIDKPGLENFHRVSETLYRGAQPTAEGMKQLEAMGIKTVVNLRRHHSDSEILRGLDMACEDIPTSAYGMTSEAVVKFLRIATDKSRAPVFVHCRHGADRTGVMCAVYRIVVHGWTKAEAIHEMAEGGFGHHWIWRNLQHFIDDLDVDDVKRRAGLD